MNNKINSTIKKIVSINLILSIVSFNFAVLPKTTVAYMMDNEVSLGNNFQSGRLDVVFNVSDFTNDNDNNISSFKPLFGLIDIFSSSSINGLYSISTSPTEDDEFNTEFCQNLEFSLNHKSSESLKFKTTLDNFTTDNIKLETSQSFDSKIQLAENAGEFEGAQCVFDLNLFAQQTPSGSFDKGFFDNESKRIIVRSPVFESTASISPIQDSSIDHTRPNDNLGNDNVIRIKSEDAQEKRGLVSFRYKLPSNLNLKYSQIVLTIKDAPQNSRTYKVNRITDSWLENNVTWNNQPAIDTNNQVVAQTGTTKNTKVAWDVTSDVQERISANQPHYGWMISDINEQSSKSITTNFYSREENDYNKKPKLVLIFDIPVVNTDHLVINEVYYDVSGGKGSDNKNEWVEVYNPTSQTVNLDGWSLCDGQSCDKIASGNYQIPPKGFAVIANEDSTWNTYWQLPDSAIRIPLGSSIGNNGLSNSGDAVILKSPQDDIIDKLSYGNNKSIFDPSIETVRKGDSISRIIKGFDNDIVDDFIENIKPNPGTNPAETSETTETLTIFEDGFMMQAGEQEIVPTLEQSTIEQLERGNLEINNQNQQPQDNQEDNAQNIHESDNLVSQTASQSENSDSHNEQPQDDGSQQSEEQPDPETQTLDNQNENNNSSIISNSEAKINESIEEAESENTGEPSNDNETTSESEITTSEEQSNVVEQVTPDADNSINNQAD